jgi:hypothetical protein
MCGHGTNHTKKRVDSSHVSHYLFVRALSAVRDDVTSANLVRHFEVRVFLRCVVDAPNQIIFQPKTKSQAPGCWNQSLRIYYETP